MTSIYQRIQEAFGTTNHSEIGRILGYEKQNIYKWRDGKSLPPTKTLLKIYEYTNCSLHWLLTGEGEMYPTRNVTTVPRKLAPGKTVRNTAPAPEQNPETGIPTAEHKLQSIPLLGAITNQQIVQEDSRVLVPFSLVEKDSVLFRIEGDNLAAEGLYDGDLLIACPAKGKHEGKIVIALLDGKIAVRHFSTTKTLALLSPVEGNRPVIKAPLKSVEVKYVVTSITRSFQ